MLRLMLCLAVAVFVLTQVQSTTPTTGIHRSTSSETTCQNTEWLGHGGEDSVCDSEHGGCDDVGKMKTFNDSTTIYSLLSAFLVALTGVVPYFVISSRAERTSSVDSKSLNRLLCFAVGSMLGDVFLHLLPETWNIPVAEGEDNISRSKKNGILVMTGLLCFCALEKLIPDEVTGKEDSSTEPPSQNVNGNNNIKNSQPGDGTGNSKHLNCKSPDISECSQSKKKIKMSGYLNLLANFTDNFTHGLAIGGSYLISFRVGLLTTGAILLHEIPHEFGDFAILLRAGYSPVEAASRQMLTATGGLIGVIVVHLFESDGFVALILPFTSGSFLYIAVCSVLPDLVKETSSSKESTIHLFIMILGIVVMALVSWIE